MSIRFEWNDSKYESNIEKHDVSFEEAKTVFFDEFADEFYDDKNSVEEERFLLLGRSFHSRLLLICHCYRENDNVIRIISARKATKNESKMYRGK